MVDFNAYMAERITKYEPLEREDDSESERLSPEKIKSYFAEKKAEFADRTPKQEKEAFDNYFKLKDISLQRNTKEHFQELKGQEAFRGRSDKDLDQLASMRANLQEAYKLKGVSPEAQKAMLEKFDRVYSQPDSLEKATSLADRNNPDTFLGAVKPRGNDTEQSH